MRACANLKTCCCLYRILPGHGSCEIISNIIINNDAQQQKPNCCYRRKAYIQHLGTESQVVCGFYHVYFAHSFRPPPLASKATSYVLYFISIGDKASCGDGSFLKRLMGAKPTSRAWEADPRFYLVYWQKVPSTHDS